MQNINETINSLLFYTHNYYNQFTLDTIDQKVDTATSSIFSNISYLSEFAAERFEKLKLIFVPVPVIEEAFYEINDDNFIESLGSSHFHLCLPALTNYLQKKSLVYKQELLIQCLVHKKEDLIPRTLSLLSETELDSLLQLTYGDQFKLKDFAKSYLVKLEIRQALYLDQNKDVIGKEIKSIMQKLLQVLTHYLNLIISSLESFTESGAPKSAWDAAFQLEVYYRMLAIPQALFLFIQKHLPNRFQHHAVFILSLTSISAFIYSYRKWLEPKPEQIPYATNLTTLVEHDSIPVFGRDVEIEETINKLMTNLTTETREHPLIIGEPGVGKTKFLSGVAKKLKGQGIAFHRIHASQLLNANTSYTNKTVLDEVLDSIKGHKEKMVIAIDDLHLIMKNKEKRQGLLSLLETGDPSRNLPLFIGITPIDFMNDEEIKKFYAKDGYARRFHPIILNELKDPAMIHLMKCIAKKTYPRIKVSNKMCSRILTANKSSNTKTLEPAKSLESLDTELRAINDQLKGKDKKEEIKNCQNQLKEIKMIISLAKNIDLIQLVKKKDKIEAEINEIAKTLDERKNHLKKYVEQKENLLKRKMKLKILAEKMLKGQKECESEFVAEHFYIIPAIKKSLKGFAALHQLNFSGEVKELV